MRRFIDATLGKWLRHLLFVIVRSYYALFYNVSCSNKFLLQDHPGALLLATHVSRHDGPLIASILYTTMRVRPTVHYNEYHHWSQWLPMHIVSAIPMSSPKAWPDEKRKECKQHTMSVIHKVLENGNSILIFPAGKVRLGQDEIVEPYLSGVHDILCHKPSTPVMLIKLDGLGKHQFAKYDGFWRFLGIRKGRRHLSVEITPVVGLDTSLGLADFNKQLETLLNS